MKHRIQFYKLILSFLKLFVLKHLWDESPLATIDSDCRHKIDFKFKSKICANIGHIFSFKFVVKIALIESVRKPWIQRYPTADGQLLYYINFQFSLIFFFFLNEKKNQINIVFLLRPLNYTSRCK